MEQLGPDSELERIGNDVALSWLHEVVAAALVTSIEELEREYRLLTPPITLKKTEDPVKGEA